MQRVMAFAVALGVMAVSAPAAMAQVRAMQAGEATVPTPATNPGEWVTENDYPSAPLRNGIEGVTRFQLNIDASGNATNCAITDSSGNGELDAATCRLMLQNARFVAARDENGNATTGIWTSSIRWQIPEEDPEVIVGAKTGGVVTDIELDKQGKIVSCSETRTENEVASAPRPCDSGFEIGSQLGVLVTDAAGQQARAKIVIKQLLSVKSIPD